jgi:transcriptional regulator with XRE-family HTH domain
VAEQPVTFASLLRTLRTGAQLTQEELAEAAGLSPRSVSDLERGIAATPRRETARLLADALHLTGPARAQFEAAARPTGDERGWRGQVRRITCDYPHAIQAHEQALGIFRTIGDRYRQAEPLLQLGIARLVTGDYTEAAQALAEALSIYRDFTDPYGQAHALCNLGEVRRLAGDYPGARQAMEEALGIYRDLGDRSGAGNAHVYLGVALRTTGDYPGAA